MPIFTTQFHPRGNAHCISPRRARQGRLLVECVVAVVMLSASAIVALSLTRSTTVTRQLAQSLAQSWAQVSVAIDGPLGITCEGSASSGVYDNGRLRMQWTDAFNGAVRNRDVRLTPLLSALAGPRHNPLTLHSARYCP